MTTQPVGNTTNKAIIVGRLGTVRGRNNKGKRVETTVNTARTSLGGTLDRFSVQLVSPFGEPYSMDLQVAKNANGVELLETLEEGSLVAVEGILRLVASYDARYARDETDKGRQVRDLQMEVTAVRVPTAEEPEGVTAVWLEGTVIEPPRLLRHPEQPTIQMAASIIELYIESEASARPGYPGLRRVSRQRIEVPFVVSTADEFAGLLLRPGNRVRVEGELTRLIETQFGAAVRDTIQAATKEWEEKKATLESEEQQRFELRRHRRRVRQLTEQARTKVVVSYAEAAGDDVVAITVDEARDLRRDYDKKRRERRSTAVARAATQARASRIGGEQPAPSEPAEPRRPRRRSVEPVVIGEMAEPAAVASEYTNGVTAEA